MNVHLSSTPTPPSPMCVVCRALLLLCCCVVVGRAKVRQKTSKAIGAMCEHRREEKKKKKRAAPRPTTLLHPWRGQQSYNRGLSLLLMKDARPKPTAPLLAKSK